MPLTHVTMRDERHGLVQINPLEAAKLFPEGLSEKSLKFVCEICMQYARLEAGGKYNPHFKHGYRSDDCEEKLSRENSVYVQTNPLGFSLPIRIRLADGQITVAVGFMPLTKDDMQKAMRDNAYVSIASESTGMLPRLFHFSISLDRFSVERLSYVNIGDTIAEKYRLSYSSGSTSFEVDKHLWPRVIEGFSPSGTLFDLATGKRLPDKSTVTVGQEYWLVIKNAYITSSYNNDVVVRKLSRTNDWDIYGIKATELSAAAIDFFRSFHVFLTDRTSIVTLLWPPAIHSSHLISCCARKTYFHKSDGFVSVYPTTARVTNERGSFFTVESHFQQLLSLSRFENRTSVLRFVMLRYLQCMEKRRKPDEVFIYDEYGHQWEAGTYEMLPSQRKLVCRFKYDGFIDILKDGYCVNRIALKGDVPVVFEVEFNRVYRIFQGLYGIFELVFTRPIEDKRFDDEKTVRLLQGFNGDTVAAPHSIGAIAQQMRDMPQTRAWLLRQIRQGSINKEALIWLQSNYGKKVSYA